MTWIWFNEPKVLDFLIRNGEVYTVRHYSIRRIQQRQAKKGNQLLGFLVGLETVGAIQDDSLLLKYWQKSGFSSLDEWKQAIERQHKNHPNLWLLKVCKG